MNKGKHILKRLMTSALCLVMIASSVLPALPAQAEQQDIVLNRHSVGSFYGYTSEPDILSDTDEVELNKKGTIRTLHSGTSEQLANGEAFQFSDGKLLLNHRLSAGDTIIFRKGGEELGKFEAYTGVPKGGHTQTQLYKQIKPEEPSQDTPGESSDSSGSAQPAEPEKEPDPSGQPVQQDIKLEYKRGQAARPVLVTTPDILKDAVSLTETSSSGKEVSYRKVELSEILTGNIFSSDTAFAYAENGTAYVSHYPSAGSVLTIKGAKGDLGKFQIRKSGFSWICEQIKENASTPDTPAPPDPAEPSPSEKEDPKDTGSSEQDFVFQSVKEVSGFDYYLEPDPSEKVAEITGIAVGNDEYTPVERTISVFGTTYCIQDNKVYISRLKEGNVIVFKGGEDHSKILGKFRRNKDGSFSKVTSQSLTTKELKVRLRGAFEAAILAQGKYDAVTAATGAAVSNKNSDVVVEIAEVDPGQNPEEYVCAMEDQDKCPAPQDHHWKLVKDSSAVHLENSRAVIVDESGREIPLSEIGMAPSYHILDSSLTLGGVPIKAGNFFVKIIAKDELNRTAESEPLPFNVYDPAAVRLENILQEKNFKQTKGGNATMWMQEPWKVYLFQKNTLEEEKQAPYSSVTVPSALQQWYGSGNSGTYGELGFPIGRISKTDERVKEPVQELIIGKGTNLLMVNMKIFSSVHIIVKDGGRLNFHDSSLYGKITVENGGTLEMNCNHHDQSPTSGSSVNGQIILENGAILENSLIYSNANNLTDDGSARRFETPVVKVNGNVRIKGKVFIRGDESATGRSMLHPERMMPGQPAMELAPGASLEIPEGSILGVYGGGKNTTTTNGGDALILGKGSRVFGEGKLIAVGGDGWFAGVGGTAVTGEGLVDTKEAFLQGGDSHDSKQPLGKPYENGVTISKRTIGVAQEGKHDRPYPEDEQTPYWRRSTIPGDGSVRDCLLYSVTEGKGTIIPGDGTKAIVAPQAHNFLFDNTEKTGVPEGEGYTLEGTAKATAAGVYQVTAKLKESYEWSDGSRNDLHLEWRITDPDANKVKKPSALTDLVYTGKEISGIPESNDYVIISGGKKTDANDPDNTDDVYTAIVRPADGKTWEDGSSEPIEIKWRILPAAQEAPAGLSASETSILGTTAAMEYRRITATPKHGHIRVKRAEGWTLCTEKETVGLSAGKYEVRFAATQNHKASDAITVTVGRKDPVKPDSPEKKDPTDKTDKKPENKVPENKSSENKSSESKPSESKKENHSGNSSSGEKKSPAVKTIVLAQGNAPAAQMAAQQPAPAPQAKGPRTGDTGHMAVYGILSAMAAGAFCLMSVRRKRK